MKQLRSLLAIAVAAPGLALASVAPAHADTVHHLVCWTGNVSPIINWPFNISTRSNGTISTVSPTAPYLSGIVLPGVSIVSGSAWETWSTTADDHGITVNGYAVLQIGWVTQDVSCQAFWSF